MSERGREQFEHSYDDLAVAALRYIGAQGGDHLVTGFARQRADDERAADTHETAGRRDRDQA